MPTIRRTVRFWRLRASRADSSRVSCCPFGSQLFAQRTVSDPALAGTRLIAVLVSLFLILSGCGGGPGVTMPSASTTNVVVAISPSTIGLQPGASQQFVATVTGASQGAVNWSVSLSGNATEVVADPGVISSDGVYAAPANLATTTTVAVKATSVANPTATGIASVTVDASRVAVTPAAATLQSGTTQAFTANTTGLKGSTLQWMVNGQVGGGTVWGTITQQGIYSAPAIDPGAPVIVSAASAANCNIAGNATVAIVNPATPALTGATYAQALASWNAVLMPRVRDRSGLEWDAASRTWSPVPNWEPPSEGIALQVYYLEPFLRPALRLAIAQHDVPLMEEIADFHLALLQYRTTTIGTMLRNAPSNAIVFIDGPPTARTFAWYEPYSSTQVEIREDEQSNAQYLSTAAQLLRAIAEMPAASRTPPLLAFVRGFSDFMVSEQLLRMMYGTTPWSYYANPNIPQPVVSAWKFLATTGYEPPHPIRYQAAMTDMELWLVADSADVLGADAAAPELAILNDSTRAQLLEAVLAGDSLLADRCHHTVSGDGADVLSVFAGEFDDHPYYAYTAATGPELPAVPDPKSGLSWDIDGSYRLPIVFRSLYETRKATGAPFPSLNDLVALANSYVHLAFNGNSQLPAFSNFLDGWNGWFRVGDPSIPDGYPPDQYCDATKSPINCLTAGAVQGWGELAFANPDLATLYQNLVNLAYDDSAETVAFKNQHYWYGGPYSANADVYPWLMIYVVGDSAERLR